MTITKQIKKLLKQRYGVNAYVSTVKCKSPLVTLYAEQGTTFPNIVRKLALESFYHDQPVESLGVCNWSDINYGNICSTHMALRGEGIEIFARKLEVEGA